MTAAKPDVLSPEGQAALEERAHGDLLLAFDYDGTLAPIVDEPDKAAVLPSTRELVRELATLYPCVVVTGRAQPDALHRLRGLGVLEVVGNHGIEPRHSSARYATLAQQWQQQLGADLADYAGVRIENKIYSLAVHYRHAAYADAARARIELAARRLPSARVVGGKAVINVIPEGAPDKGTAVIAAMRRRSCTAAVYVGDDVTDEDVFTLARTEPVLGVHVGTEESLAQLVLQRQEQIDTLLGALIRFRST